MNDTDAYKKGPANTYIARMHSHSIHTKSNYNIINYNHYNIKNTKELQLPEWLSNPGTTQKLKNQQMNLPLKTR